MEKKWICYILLSLDTNRTYVGATDNLYRRLCDHNGLHGQSRGAKATKGQQWIPIVFISGFNSKIVCLSFESGIRRMPRRRCKKQYKCFKNKAPINTRLINLYNLMYAGSPIKKWQPINLTINWLEREYYNKSYQVPEHCLECFNLNEMIFD